MNRYLLSGLAGVALLLGALTVAPAGSASATQTDETTCYEQATEFRNAKYTQTRVSVDANSDTGPWGDWSVWTPWSGWPGWGRLGLLTLRRRNA